MYNPQKIYDLLKERNLKNRELLDALGMNWNGSLSQVVSGNIRADKIEAIADFFGVPIDYFFDRSSVVSGVQLNGNGHKVGDISVNDNSNSLLALIDEKDKRIAILEEMITMLKEKKS